MSASLVGSEMCIRDRILLSPHLASPALPGGQKRSRPAQAPCTAPSRPVSYTHLTLPTICSV
eukprot:5266848-Alexandrium_andersonii.AAC.1